jgi:hypothetical protein
MKFIILFPFLYIWSPQAIKLLFVITTPSNYFVVIGQKQNINIQINNIIQRVNLV